MRKKRKRKISSLKIRSIKPHRTVLADGPGGQKGGTECARRMDPGGGKRLVGGGNGRRRRQRGGNGLVGGHGLVGGSGLVEGG